jgi:hypothetical protein
MSNLDTLDETIVGDFIDAAVQDQHRARELLHRYPQLRDARWIHEETILHFLAVEGFTDAVRFVGGLGFDVSIPNEFGDQPLIDVATLGNDQMAEVLLSLGADPNATSDTRDNVLHCAVRTGNRRLVDLLLEAGAKADYVTDSGETVFDVLPDDQVRREVILATFARHNVSQSSQDNESAAQPSARIDYTRGELEAIREGLPARGRYCAHCGKLIPVFSELTENEERRVRDLCFDRPMAATLELKAFAGCPQGWAELWVEHAGRPKIPTTGPPAPCPYCGEPLRTHYAKQCRFCKRDWHDPSNVRNLGE